MDASGDEQDPSTPRSAWLWPGLALVLGLLAYRPLLAGVLASGAPGALDAWLFRPAALPLPLVLVSAAWLLWRRRERWRALTPVTAPGWTVVVGVTASLVFGWSGVTGARDLLFAALAAQLLAFAAATRGRAGLRVFLAPAVVLLLGLHPPALWLEEVVWRLQQWTARGSTALLEIAGYAPERSGVMMDVAGHSFHVIDGCSGLQGMSTLLLVSILIRELVGGGRRTGWVIAAAPIVGFALNLVRIAAVAASDDPQALAGPEGDHTLQGLSVLAAGTALLYGGALWSSGPAAPELAALQGASPTRAWAGLAAWLAALAVMTLALPGAVGERPTPQASRLQLPPEEAGWTSEGIPIPPYFVGTLAGPDRIHRRYSRAGRPPMVVELFAARGSPAEPSSNRLFSSRLHVPGPDWERLETSTTRIWMLGRDAQMSVAVRSTGEHALVYTWVQRDQGSWRESLRSLLALDRVAPRDPPRVVVRLLSYAPHDGPFVLELAKQRLDRFVNDFRAPLGRL